MLPRIGPIYGSCGVVCIELAAAALNITLFCCCCCGVIMSDLSVLIKNLKFALIFWSVPYLASVRVSSSHYTSRLTISAHKGVLQGYKNYQNKLISFLIETAVRPQLGQAEIEFWSPCLHTSTCTCIQVQVPYMYMYMYNTCIHV